MLRTSPSASRPIAIASSAAINLAGALIPALAAMAAFPALNRNLGTERVGFLTLAWALIGYFGLFDMGISRALTKLVAERLNSVHENSIPQLVWTGLTIMTALGVVAAVSMAIAARWLVVSALSIPAEMQLEAIGAVHVLALTVPFVVITAGLRGVIEAQGRFLTSNLIRAPLGAWFVAGPLLLAPFGTRSLESIAWLLFVGRLLACGAFVLSCLQGFPGLRHGPRLDLAQIRPLLSLGGWITVSNIISPIMVYMDRFLLGSITSLEAVAWYATPWEMVTKILLIPGAVVGVLFPLFSAAAAARHGEAKRIYLLSVRYTGLVLLVPTFAAALFAREALTVWMGPVFAEHSYRVAAIIAAGTFLNGIAHVPFGLLQGAGRADITARVHLLELPLYLAMVLVLTDRFGVVGTAVAWSLRVGLDLLLLSELTNRLIGSRSLPRLRTMIIGGAAASLFGLAALGLPLLAKLILFAAVLVGIAVYTWSVLLEKDDLIEMKARILRRRS